VCLLIPLIGGFKFLEWCRRGGGGNPIRCVHPSALSPLLRRWLRRHGGARRMCCPSAQVTDRIWCIMCWVCGWNLVGLIFSPDIVVVWGCQFWSSIACWGTCCPGLILSTTMVLPLANYFSVFYVG
jgi:hypothetical protein